MQVIVLVPRGSQKVEKLKKLENDETMSKIAVLPAWELISKKSRNLILRPNWWKCHFYLHGSFVFKGKNQVFRGSGVIKF